MENLQRQVGRAYRRLLLQRLVHQLPWWWFGGLMVAAVPCLVGRFVSIAVDDTTWVVAALAAGTLGSVIATYAGRASAVEAAIEIDRRFGLKERISSSMTLHPDERDTPFAKALVNDAIRRAERLDVADRFAVSPGRWAWLPAVPAIVVFLLAVFVDPFSAQRSAEARQEKEAQRKQVVTSTEQLQQRLAQQRKEAQEKNLQQAEELFQKLEAAVGKDLNRPRDMDLKKALVKLNDLAKELEDRKQKLGGSDEIKHQLNRLKDLSQGPADRMADAMRRGNFEQALKELKALREKLEGGKLDEEAQKQLAEQLTQLEQKLRDAAAAHQQMQQRLQKQIEQMKAAGQNAAAEELERQLAQLQRQSPAIDRLKQMANNLGQAAQCMRNGDSNAASDNLASLGQSLSQLQQQLEESQLLEGALDQIAQAKSSMHCENCDGAGCSMCQGGGLAGGMMGRGDRLGGMGLGEGKGRGPRPEQEGNVGFIDSQVRQKVGRGAASVVDFVDGPNTKGDVRQAIEGEFTSSLQKDSNPLTGQRLPRKYREHAEKYFDALREGR